MTTGKIGYLHNYPWVDSACFLALLFFATQPNAKTIAPELAHVLGLFKALGSIAAIGVPLTGTVLQALFSFNPPSLYTLLQWWVRSATAYMAAVWILEHHVNTWILNNDNDMVIASLAIGLLLATSACVPFRRLSHVAFQDLNGAQARSITRSSDDEINISVHEASHAMLYAALATPPDYLYVTVEPNGEAHGHVSGIKQHDVLPTMDFAYWFMLLYLAGQQGEQTLLGKKTLGAISDLDVWSSYAQIYLANHFRGVYTLKPRNRWEHQSNERKLEEFKAEQHALLDLFFKMNKEITLELAQTLREKRTLQRQELLPYLSKVVFPDGMPFNIGLKRS